MSITCITYCIILFLCRGYGDTTIPSLNVKDYTIDILAQDIKEVVSATTNINSHEIKTSRSYLIMIIIVL